jgi:hypothetical protein
MSDKQQIIVKIKQVAAGAAQFREEQFRTVMGGLIRRGGKEAELLMVKYITDSGFPDEARTNLMVAAGEVKSPLFLVPLKKVVDDEPNVHLKKAAIYAISAYNDQKALSLLNSALQTVGNQFVKNIINEQIDIIKRNNPILALLPRFLKPDLDLKGIMVVKDLLKKNMRPSDAPIFINLLNSKSHTVRNGSFELLCLMGDRTIQNSVFNFFFKQADVLLAEDPPGENELNLLAKNLKVYFLRFPSLIFRQLSKIKELFPLTTDLRTQKLLLSAICHCRAPEALSFTKDIYDHSEADLREFIIEESAGNEQAVDFLFEKYRAGQSLKEKVVKALLKNRKGFQYFAEHFFSFESDHQEMIIKSLPTTLDTVMVGFIKNLFKSDLKHLKSALLIRIRANYLYSFKDILFDPEREEELLAMEEDYLTTIARLFPILTIQKLLTRAALDEPEIFRLKMYFSHIQDIIRHDVAITIKEPELLPQLATKVVNASSPELNETFLNILEKIKTFDMTTYKNLYDTIVQFTSDRGDNLIEEENYMMKRVRDNFKNIIDDIRKIEVFEKDIKRNLMKAVPDLHGLRKILETYHIGAAFKMDWVARAISDYFKKSPEKFIVNWREFFKDFPIITQLVKEHSQNGEKSASYHDKLRIVIRFQESEITALLKDQVHQVLPNFVVTTNVQHLEPTDILVADSHCLKEFLIAKTLNTKRVFVYMDNRAEFATFKSLNPKSFLPPLSIYKVMKFILSELYLMRPG